MSIDPDDIRTQLRALREDLTKAQGRITDIRALREDLTKAQGRITDIGNMLNELALPPATDHRCPQCGVRLRGPLSLAEHLHTSHNGPLPQHWAAAEQAAGLTEEEPIAHG